MLKLFFLYFYDMRVIFMLQLQLVKNKMAINSIHELWQKKQRFCV